MNIYFEMLRWKGKQNNLGHEETGGWLRKEERNKVKGSGRRRVNGKGIGRGRKQEKK